MASNGKYPVTGRETPVGEILVVLALSALVVLMATQWRAHEVENWEGWLALALLPGVLLRWLEIVRRTAWPLLEIATAALMTGIAALGFARLGGAPLACGAIAFAGLAVWLAWRRFGARGA